MNNRNRPFNFSEESSFEDLGGGIKRKILAYGDNILMAEVHFEKGAEGKMHSHPHTQVTYVLDGVFEFTIGENKKTVKKGDALYKIPNINHGCVCIEKGILLDIFSPCREDFISDKE